MITARFDVVSLPLWISVVQAPILRSGLESGLVHHFTCWSRVCAAAGTASASSKAVAYARLVPASAAPLRFLQSKEHSNALSVPSHGDSSVFLAGGSDVGSD